MSALEGQLTRALRRLSAQYEREQRRHSEQVEALRRQVERLSGENEILSAANRAARRAGDRLDRVLRDIWRRETARPRLVIRPPPRGPDRDAGPSR